MNADELAKIIADELTRQAQEKNSSACVYDTSYWMPDYAECGLDGHFNIRKLAETILEKL